MPITKKKIKNRQKTNIESKCSTANTHHIVKENNNRRQDHTYKVHRNQLAK
jgi:hypothetical protein